MNAVLSFSLRCGAVGVRFFCSLRWTGRNRSPEAPEMNERFGCWLRTSDAELSPSTAATHRASIEQHLAPFFGARDLRVLTRDHIRASAVDRFDARKSAATITNALSVLRRVYSLHVEAGVLERNPAQGRGDMVQKIARRYDNVGIREVDAWTRGEVAILLHTAQEHERYVYPVLMAAIATGMRRGELLALRWEDIGEEEMLGRSALVRRKIKTPKSDKARSVPIYISNRIVFLRLRRSGSRSRNSGGTDFIANQILAASSPLTESPVISLLSQANCTYAQHRQAKRHQGDAAHGWHLRDITRVG